MAYYKTRNTGTRNDGTTPQQQNTTGTPRNNGTPPEQSKDRGTVSGGIRVRFQQELDVVTFFRLGIAMSWFFSLGIPMLWHFVPWKNVLESRCRGLIVSVSRCRGFLALESRCRGFLVLESRCRGICASTASFSFSLNLLCHIINVNMWVVNWCKLFCIS